MFNTSRWDTRQEYKQLNQTTGTTKTPSGKPKKNRNGPPVIKDGNDKRPEAIENTRMLSRKKAIRQHPRGIQPIQAEIIHKIWISILRRENLMCPQI